MKLFSLIITLLKIVSVVSQIPANCNKLWGMNNEINGVTVSEIGVYMCVNDPLNLYKNIPKNINENTILQTDKIINYTNTTNITSSNESFINLTSFPSTTTFLPSTTTFHPSTTTIPSTKTSSPITTTSSPITTTTTLSPIETITTIAPNLPKVSTTTLSINENKTNMLPSKTDNLKNLKKDIDDSVDIGYLVTISILSCIILSYIFYRLCPIVFKLIKKCTKKIKKNKEKVKLDIKEVKKHNKQVSPKRVNPINTQHTIDIPSPQNITPKRKVSLGFNTMGQNTDWYKETFKKELSEFKDVENDDNPPLPSIKRDIFPPPSAPVPTLQANFNNTKKIEHANHVNRPKHNHVNSMKKTGHVAQQVNSIERRTRKQDFRNVRLNSWNKNPRNQREGFKN